MDLNKVFQRAKNILLQPAKEWEAIQAENATRKTVIVEYAVPMLVLILMAALLGSLIFHTGYRLTFGYIIANLIIALLVTGGGMYISALLINETVPGFGGIKNQDVTFNLIVYSYTAFIVSYAAAQLLNIFPLNILFNLCGLYSIYIFYTGVTPMLKVPDDRKMGFTIVAVLIMIAVSVVLGVILGIIFAGAMVSTKGFTM